MRLSGVFLLAGFAAFATGGLLPPSRAFTGTRDEQRQIVGEHPTRWVASAVALGTGVVLTLAGLALLSAVLVDGARTLSILAVVSFGLGATLFLIELTFRATVFVAVATVDQDIPGWFDPLAAWAGAAYWTYMPLGYMSVAAVGGAIVQTSALGPPTGWGLVAFGLLGAAGYVARRPRLLWKALDIPGLLYVVTGATGVALLLAP